MKHWWMLVTLVVTLGCSKPVEVQTTDPDTKFTAAGDSAGVAIVQRAHPALPADEAELVKQVKASQEPLSVDVKVLKLNRGQVTLTTPDGKRIETDAQAEVEVSGGSSPRTAKRTWVRHVSGLSNMPAGKWLVF